MTQLAAGFSAGRRMSYVSLCAWFLLGFAGLTTVYVAIVEVVIHGETVVGAHTSAGYGSEPKGNFHYAVVIDAGSSGSRAYLYAWPPHSGDRSTLLAVQPVRNGTGVLFPDRMGNAGAPLHKMITPGLSSMAGDSSKAAEYFYPLLDFAQAHIPANKISETPLYILATAGMRLLKTSEQNEILHHVRRGIPKRYNFFFPPGNVEIISGRQEGVYQWIAMNYGMGLLANPQYKHKQRRDVVVVENPLDPDRHLHRVPTSGILDMGGASLQIAFEVTSTDEAKEIKQKGPMEGEVLHVNLGPFDDDPAHMFRVFVTTYLGFGANEKMAHHREILVTSSLNASKGHLDEAEGLTKDHPIQDPCMPMGLETAYKMKPAEFLPKKTARLYFGIRDGNSSSSSSTSVETVSPALVNVPVVGGNSSIAVAVSASPLAVTKRSRFVGTVPEEVDVYFAGTGDFDTCLKAIKPLTNKWRREDKACLDMINFLRRRSADNSRVARSPRIIKSEHESKNEPSCNPRPVMVPPGVTLAKRAFYGFSEFWYSSEDVLRLGGKAYDRKTLGTAVKNWCETEWHVLWDRYEKKLYPNSDENRMREECFKGAWVLVALHHGLGFPEDYGNLKTLPNVHGDQVFTWTLGAVLQKMRKFPLRAIELRETQMTQLLHPRYVHSFWSSFRLHSSFLIICVILVLFFIAFQLRRLVSHSIESSSPYFRRLDEEDTAPFLRHSASTAAFDPEGGYGRRKLPHSASFAWFDRLPSSGLPHNVRRS